MIDAKLDLKQLRKIKRQLTQLKLLMSNKLIIEAMEEWATLVDFAARKFVPAKTGALRSRINHYIFKLTTKELTMKISTRPKGWRKRKGDIPYEFFLEYGTAPHWVGPVDKKALSWVEGSTRYFSKGHMVSGIMATRFMQRAYLVTRNRGKKLLARAIKIQMRKTKTY
jgi:hypothetical protein